MCICVGRNKISKKKKSKMKQSWINKKKLFHQTPFYSFYQVLNDCCILKTNLNWNFYFSPLWCRTSTLGTANLFFILYCSNKTRGCGIFKTCLNGDLIFSSIHHIAVFLEPFIKWDSLEFSPISSSSYSVKKPK